MTVNKVPTIYLYKKNIQPFYETVIQPVNYSRFNEADLFEIVDRVTISDEAKKMYLKSRAQSMISAKNISQNSIKRIPITSKQLLLEYKDTSPANQL